MYHDLFNYVKKMYLIVLIPIDIICHKCNINSVRNGVKNENTNYLNRVTKRQLRVSY